MAAATFAVGLPVANAHAIEKTRHSLTSSELAAPVGGVSLGSMNSEFCSIINKPDVRSERCDVYRGNKLYKTTRLTIRTIENFKNGCLLIDTVKIETEKYPYKDGTFPLEPVGDVELLDRYSDCTPPYRYPANQVVTN